MSFREMEDKGDHFAFYNKNGHEVRVAKKGLSDAMLKKVQGMAMGGNYAKGGQVKTEGPVSPETADSFNQGFFKPTGDKPPPKKVASYADGGPVEDPTLALTEDQDGFSQAPAPMPMEQQIPVEETKRDLASMSGWDQMKQFASAVGDKAKQAYNAVDSTQLGHTLLTGGQESGPPPQGPVQQQGQPVLQNASAEQAAPGFQRLSLGEGNVPRGTQAGIQIPMGIDPMQAAGQLQKGIQGEAQAIGQLGQQQARLYDQEANKYQNLMTNYEEQQKHLLNEYEAIKQDYAAGHIDPNHYFENRGTFGNVRTALGMLLGGIGAGLTGGENPVLKYVNAQIDRDIDSQKANLGKKENLLNANLKQYGNLKDAMVATKMAYAGMMEAQINKLVAQNKSPLAQAQAQKALASMQLELAPKIQELAMRQAGLKMMQQGSNQINPAMQIRFLVPKEQQQEAYKEMQGLENLKKAGINALHVFDQVANMSLSGAFSPRQKAALIGPVVAQLSKDTAGRFTEQDSQMLMPLMPQVGDPPDTLKVKRNALNNLLAEKMNSPLLESFGIASPKLSGAIPLSTGPGYQKASMVK